MEQVNEGPNVARLSDSKLVVEDPAQDVRGRNVYDSSGEEIDRYRRGSLRRRGRAEGTLPRGRSRGLPWPGGEALPDPGRGRRRGERRGGHGVSRPARRSWARRRTTRTLFPSPRRSATSTTTTVSLISLALLSRVPRPDWAASGQRPGRKCSNPRPANGVNFPRSTSSALMAQILRLIAFINVALIPSPG